MAAEDLESVNGGYLYHNHAKTIDVIDDKSGNVLDSVNISSDVWKRFQNMRDAEKKAAKLNQSKAYISDDQLNQLRRTGSIA